MAPTQSTLAPCDSRSMLLAKMRAPSGQGAVKAALRGLSLHLVSDSYGAVQAVRLARDAYNQRQKVRFKMGVSVCHSSTLV